MAVDNSLEDRLLITVGEQKRPIGQRTAETLSAYIHDVLNVDLNALDDGELFQPFIKMGFTDTVYLRIVFFNRISCIQYTSQIGSLSTTTVLEDWVSPITISSFKIIQVAPNLC